jgi:hypothetical protein
MPFTAIDHVGFIAGRYRNGALSDAWTEVDRCAEGTFTAYVAACACGWHGPAHRPDDLGSEACRRDWVHGHAALVGPAPVGAAGVGAAGVGAAPVGPAAVGAAPVGPARVGAVLSAAGREHPAPA